MRALSLSLSPFVLIRAPARAQFKMECRKRGIIAWRSRQVNSCVRVRARVEEMLMELCFTHDARLELHAWLLVLDDTKARAQARGAPTRADTR